MSDYTFQVDLKGMIHLLSDSLYANDSVFLRELLQNAADAIEARRNQEPEFADPQIEVHLDGEGVLEFTDNGIGLTEEEIHTFLAVIGKSSKRDNLRQQGFIGQFGIGLLSCFLVADTIEVFTRSAQSQSAFRWLGQSSGSYSVTPAPEYTRCGTTVRLRLTGHMRDKYDSDAVGAHLGEYGFLLPIPIWLDAPEGRVQVNDAFVPFREEFYTKAQLLEFGQSVFEHAFLDAIPLREEGLSGCIFLSAAPASAATVQRHKIYLKNMLVTEDGKELVPQWAFFVQCFINAEELSPTASREGFCRNNKLSAARAQIERCIIDYMLTMSEVDPTQLQRIIRMHSTAFKSLASEQGRVFKLLFPFLLFTTSAGEATGAQLLQAAKKGTVYYCETVDTFRKMRPLLEGSKTLLVNGGYVYDAGLLRRAAHTDRALHFQELSDEMIGDVLQPPTREEEDQFAALLEQAGRALHRFGCDARLRRFSPAELASLFAPGALGFFAGMEQGSGEDFFAPEDFFADEGADDLGGELVENCLYLNAACPLLSRIAAVNDQTISSMLAEVLYLQALMQGGHPLGQVEMKLLNQNLTRLIELGLQ